jgi:hypothetical protein
MQRPPRQLPQSHHESFSHTLRWQMNPPVGRDPHSVLSGQSAGSQLQWPLLPHSRVAPQLVVVQRGTHWLE